MATKRMKKKPVRRSRGLKGIESDALCRMLKKDWIGVRCSSEGGSANIPNIGTVEFVDSTNDAAVIVRTSGLRFKTRPGEAKRVLEKIRKILSTTGV